MQQSIKKRKNGIETKNRILKISSGLFAHKGYNGVSVHEIAAQAGIKESSLYNHFKSKADILDTLLDLFMRELPLTRPSESELNQMVTLMEPRELLKNLVLVSSRNISKTLANTAMIINLEKFHYSKAAALYFDYVVDEPASFYERLFLKMAEQRKIKAIDARAFAEQYNYAYIALTKEYYMAENGFTDMKSVMEKLKKTIDFFCDLMK